MDDNVYEILGARIGRLVREKQRAYGDSFTRSGDVLKILYPTVIRPDQYVDVLCIVRMIDKMFRIATEKKAFGESPYNDLAGYALLGAVRDARDAGEFLVTPDEVNALQAEPTIERMTPERQAKLFQIAHDLPKEGI